jgi:hypothetical protein
MKQVGTPNLTLKDTPGLIRHNLHTNKCCSKMSPKSEELSRLQEVFLPPTKSVEITSCCEGRNMKRQAGKVVPKSSAMLGLMKENIIMIDSDHPGICKSSGDDVCDYEKVESEIKKLAYIVTTPERLDTVHGHTEVIRDAKRWLVEGLQRHRGR